MPQDSPPFSIILPVHNEELAVEQVISGLIKQFEGCEIVAVDDGSEDNSYQELAKFDINIVRHEKKRGYGAALKSGIKNSTSDFIIIMDCDGTFAPQDIPNLLQSCDGHDMVVGARLLGNSGEKTIHKWIKGSVCLALSVIFRQRILDVNSGFRLMRKEVVCRYLSILPDRFSFTASITLAMLIDGHKIKYVPIVYSPRIGKSKVRKFKYALNFIRNYWRVFYHLKLVKRS